MDAFHVVIDTSVLRQAHFQHPDFARLLRRSQMGALKIYIPHIVLEEERTRLLGNLLDHLERIKSAYEKLKGGNLRMLIEGLPEARLSLWSKEEVERNSRAVYDKFLTENKIEKLVISPEHAINAWARYFDVAPPFNPNEERENRRKDIPDSWILEAALEIKAKRGRHCALVADGKLKAALKQEGFEIFGDVQTLDDEIENAIAVVNVSAHDPDETLAPLDQLRGLAFKDIDLIVLGMNEALNAPSKVDLFAQLERGGINRAIAEHEAQTLVLSGVLTDSGSHFIPTNRAQARRAMETAIVTELLIKIL